MGLPAGSAAAIARLAAVTPLMAVTPGLARFGKTSIDEIDERRSGESIYFSAL